MTASIRCTRNHYDYPIIATLTDPRWKGDLGTYSKYIYQRLYSEGVYSRCPKEAIVERIGRSAG